MQLRFFYTFIYKCIKLTKLEIRFEARFRDFGLHSPPSDAKPRVGAFFEFAQNQRNALTEVDMTEFTQGQPREHKASSNQCVATVWHWEQHGDATLQSPDGLKVAFRNIDRSAVFSQAVVRRQMKLFSVATSNCCRASNWGHGRM